MNRLVIRDGMPADADLIAELIRELAGYENLLGEAHPDPEALRRDLRADAIPRAYCLIAEFDGAVAGFAFYFFRYSTFESNWGIHLEDFYVREQYRGLWAGKGLLQKLAQIALEGGHTRVYFEVLRWNKAAIEVYKHLGAADAEQWMPMRFSGDALARLAAGKIR